MDKRLVLKTGISTGAYSEFLDRIGAQGRARCSSAVFVANVHMCIEAWADDHFAAVVNAADIVTPDGMPLVVALKIIHGIVQQRVDGMSLLPRLLERAQTEKLSVFFYGSTQDVLDAMLSKTNQSHPNLNVAGCWSPPFRNLTPEEETDIVARINDSGANLVLVALGCPKQERWIASMKGRIRAVMIGVGGAFPVYAGLQQRAPAWMQRWALEWLFRLGQEPRRLLKRYLVTNSLFLFLMIKELFRIKVVNRLA